MRFGLNEAVIQKMQAVFSRFPLIECVTLYGSRAKGNFKPGSDIDLTLHGDALTAKQLRDVAEALDDLLLPYTIDLAIHDQLDDADLLAHIDRVGQAFYVKATTR
jgi:predicted nucleotidyltransferase